CTSLPVQRLPPAWVTAPLGSASHALATDRAPQAPCEPPSPTTVGCMSAETVAIGLQEWQVCCDALVAGDLILAVRKGGIHEHRGGLFAPEHDRFALLPTWLHQDASRLRPGFPTPVRPPAPAGTIPVPGWCAVERVCRVADLAAVQALGAELAWSQTELATRFAYRDQPFLFVLALRAWRFATPIVITDEPAYAGCR